MKYKGDCDVCRKKKSCKKSEVYIKQIAKDIVEDRAIKVCKDWR